MSKSGKKSQGNTEHVAKADVRHKYKVAEFSDFSRHETGPDGTEKMVPRVAVLTPEGGGKQVRAYVPGNLDGQLEVGSVVMCRPHDKPNKGDGPPIKFRITNVVDGSESGTLTPAQNAQMAGRAGAEARPMADQRADARR